MSQTEKILRYMQETGSITPLEALEHFGCMRLAARISDLKARGYKIKTKTQKSRNRYGEKISFARYELEE